MIHVPYSHVEKKQLIDALNDTVVRTRPDIHILNHEEKPIDSLTAPVNRLVSGSVTIDVTGDTSRSAEIVVADEEGKLRFEAKSPVHGAIFVDRFLEIHYEVWVPAASRWMRVPIFQGPISGYERDGVEVTISAIGKESLMRDPLTVYKGYTLKKGTRVSDAIARVAHEAGESHLRINKFKHQRLSSDRMVSEGAEPWDLIAGGKHPEGLSMRVRTHTGGKGKGKQDKKDKKFKRTHAPGLIHTIKDPTDCFMNGRGQLAARHDSQKVCYRFHWGRDIATRPTLSYDEEAFINCVILTCGKPKGKSKPIRVVAELPPGNPLSPHALRRKNGKPRRYIMRSKAENITKYKDAVKHARKLLRKHSKEGVDISFECLPMPLLEENDWVELVMPEYKFKFQVKQMTISLTSDELMSLGYSKHIKKPRRHRRKHHRGASISGHGGGRKHHHHHKHKHHHHKHHHKHHHHHHRHHHPKHHHHKHRSKA